MFKKSMLLSIQSVLALLVILAASLMPTWAAEQEPSVAWEKIDRGVMLIDVRTAEEFAEGHIDGAMNIPFNNIVPELAKLNITKDTEIVLYCRSGNRSDMAQKSLVKQGYSNTYNAGGFNSLISAR
ncbi:MAG: rhodanese [Shewanella sp. CG18_big_fil_WC_8_21_14_2_50_42_11]|nr:MAG: rhodanese [Shewanella sp. CG18_big_fil_WC_8_21_14_2_50_42_11]PIX69730.1 MAG: rhodanese-like domain-containing protein [Shewanella sp. CG_4_10_14_3_um_filter_42_91]PIY63719.1 MAG: rhodanese-like domain-containing protein [Shewanella sp. CG_4_10_14_0_8_um_filter_42_13]PJB89797.1 MAG: rhodanese-like domain-containing protein [Shewanella sp. CG_4_9_14_0_8_um_filter_42_14]RPA51157.1 rhodanese-like domain-containing protein [Shewanella vesiculosa]